MTRKTSPWAHDTLLKDNICRLSVTFRGIARIEPCPGLDQYKFRVLEYIRSPF